MAGEGRGHATRMRALVEKLRSRHRLHLFAPGNAFEILAPTYAGTEVEVTAIPGIFNAYSSDRRLDYLETGRRAAGYFSGLPKLVRALRDRMDASRPDLVICDFEPALPRAARAAHVPYMAVDHQHFLVVNDLSSLPWRLRFHAKTMRPIVKFIYRPPPRAVVVSSFYAPPLEEDAHDVEQVGVFLRPQVLARDPEPGRHILVYLRKFGPPDFMRALRAIGRPTIVYGLGVRPPDHNLTFRAIDEDAFVDDLAGADALISTAGNQIVGEALYLQKPVLAMPEANNFEQAINAHFLRQSGAGDFVPLEKCRTADVKRFLDRLDSFRRFEDRTRLDGTEAAAAAVERQLELLGCPIPEPRFQAGGLRAQAS
jgi:uncharacterized protein (TIGR00661 family)